MNAFTPHRTLQDCVRAMSLRTRATHASHRAVFHRLGLSVGIAIALAGCGADAKPKDERSAYYGILRTRLFQQCMASASKVTPASIADRGSWSEVVERCGDQAYYQANTCLDAQACLGALNMEAGK